MLTLEDKVTDFLNQKRIAVAGVSRTKQSPANLIYNKLKGAGYQVFAVNPNTATFQSDPCYADLKSITEGIDGVVIVTRPELTAEIVRQCADAGVSRVWMHQSFSKGTTSVSDDAVRFCKEHSISVIDGACPMMFCHPVDFGHKCMRWVLHLTGGLPK
jgi:predicted CoA-binding protein